MRRRRSLLLAGGWWRGAPPTPGNDDTHTSFPGGDVPPAGDALRATFPSARLPGVAPAPRLQPPANKRERLRRTPHALRAFLPPTGLTRSCLPSPTYPVLRPHLWPPVGTAARSHLRPPPHPATASGTTAHRIHRLRHHPPAHPSRFNVKNLHFHVFLYSTYVHFSQIFVILQIKTMSRTLALFHTIISTRNRAQSITPEHESELYCFLGTYLAKNNCFVIAINGMPNHIHILFDLNPRFSLADIIGELKRLSSLWIKQSGLFPQFNGWSSGYCALSVSLSNKQGVINYINSQKVHHQNQSFDSELKTYYDIHDFDYHPSELT